MEALKLKDYHSPTGLEIPAKLFKEFLGDFASEATKKTYEQSIMAFKDYINEAYPDVSSPSHVERNMVINYKNFIIEAGGLNGEKMAPNTVAKHLGAISSFFGFLLDKKIITENPASNIRRPRRETVRPTKAISKEQVDELLKSVDLLSSSGPLHLSLLATLWLTGLRKSEILNLKRKDYYKEKTS